MELNQSSRAPQSKTWFTLPKESVLKHFNASVTKGLSEEMVREHKLKYGENQLEKKNGIGLFGIVLAQFKSPLVLILLLAGVATLFLEVYLDTLVIFVALGINLIIGSIQERRAGLAFEKLNDSQEKYATVIRGSKKSIIPLREVVVGDIVLLESGMYIPADVRLIEAKELSVNEAILTGEWVSVSKDAEKECTEDTALAERANMAWMGTLVAEGSGVGVVVSVGKDTQMGRIAEQLLSTVERATPLQQSIHTIARFLVVMVFVAVVGIFALGIVAGESIANMILVSIAIAVAAMPSGLPAAVTIVLAIGMEAILKKGGLVRNLLAAETLGSTTIILTDKTGTLTEAKMKVSGLYTLEGLEDGNTEPSGDNHTLLTSAIYATDAFIEKTEGEGQEKSEQIIVHGRPIEKALTLLGLDHGLVQEGLHHDSPRIDFLPFESRRRFAGSLHSQINKKSNVLYLSGAPETLLGYATHVLYKGKSEALTPTLRKKLEVRQAQMSAQGFRFIALSKREVRTESIVKLGEKEGEHALDKSTFLGLVAFTDPVRTDVPDSIRVVKNAGVRVVMVTGDNPQTAKRIAIEVGIAKETDTPKTGNDIEKYSDEELFEVIKETPIFARVLPEQKLRIARILKDHHEVVAMTGDGVNDAPALQSADIGVAVGSGTEVAKAASDIVLLNNSFSIITSAIEEGRRIIDNLKKIVSYLLSTSFSEIALIGTALAVGAPLPLLPGQILWANIVEEGFMSFSFAFEGAEKGSMKRDPRETISRQILTPKIKKLIAIISIVTSVFLISLYFILLKLGLPIEEIRTIMFVSLSLDSIFFAFSFKSLHKPIWNIPLFSNRYLFVALGISLALLILAIVLPPLQTLLSLTVLTQLEVLLLVGVGIFNLLIIEVTKYFVFERRK